MAKKMKINFDEGFVRGKKVFLLGALPVILFFLLVGGSAYVISNFANSLTVNKDKGVCNTVRRQYPNSVQADWPCDTSDQGDYILVSFNQSSNTGQAAAIMSFKYDKKTKIVKPAIEIK